MDRRTIAATVSGLFVSGGLAAVIGATALPPASPYFQALMAGGWLAVGTGIIGLGCLFLFRPKPRPIAPARGPRISVTGAGSVDVSSNEHVGGSPFLQAQEVDHLNVEKNRLREE